jgi:hypothetical protein
MRLGRWSLCAWLTIAPFWGMSSATAATGGSAELILEGSIEPRCSFTDVPEAKALGPLATGQTLELGTLGFRCNLPDNPDVQLTIQSQHGALTRDGGSESVGYAASWDVQGHGNDYTPAADFAAQHGFSLGAGGPGATQSGVYRIRITGDTTALAAGTYRDRITYTVSP